MLGLSKTDTEIYQVIDDLWDNSLDVITALAEFLHKSYVFSVVETRVKIFLH